VLTAYGEILFRAWRDSVGGPLQWDIEADCIQVLRFPLGIVVVSSHASFQHKRAWLFIVGSIALQS
jgi:hypothetical protein